MNMTHEIWEKKLGELQKLISDGKSELAIDVLLGDQNLPIKTKGILISLQARKSELKNKEYYGILNHNEYTIENNKINAQLIRLLLDFDISYFQTRLKPNVSKNIFLMAATFFSIILAGGLIFKYYSSQSSISYNHSLNPIYYNTSLDSNALDLFFISDTLKIKDAFKVSPDHKVGQLKNDLIFHYGIREKLSIPSSAIFYNWSLSINNMITDKDTLSLYEAGARDGDIIKVTFHFSIPTGAGFSYGDIETGRVDDEVAIEDSFNQIYNLIAIDSPRFSSTTSNATSFNTEIKEKKFSLLDWVKAVIILILILAVQILGIISFFKIIIRIIKKIIIKTKKFNKRSQIN